MECDLDGREEKRDVGACRVEGKRRERGLLE